MVGLHAILPAPGGFLCVLFSVLITCCFCLLARQGPSGIVLLLHHTWPVTGVHREQADFGKYLNVVLASHLCLVFCYHAGTNSLAANLDDAMHFFSEAHGPSPMSVLGDSTGLC